MTDLRNYISQIKKLKQLKIVKTKVSTKFEIAAITAKLDGSDAVLFENIKESQFNLISNLVGTRQRFALAVGANDNNIHTKVISAIKKAKKPKIISSGKFMENKSQDISVMPIVEAILKKNLDRLLLLQLHMQKILKLENKTHLFIRLMPIDKNHFSIRMVEGRHLHRCFVDAKNMEKI